MNLSEINTITLSQYGFRVFDWDDNRGDKDGAGPIVLGNVQINEDDQRNLQGLTDQEIANFFNKTINKFENITISGKKYWPMSIHMTGSSLFILGDQVRKPSFHSLFNRELGIA